MLAAACSGEMALSSVSSRSGWPYLRDRGGGDPRLGVAEERLEVRHSADVDTGGEFARREGQRREREIAPVRTARDRDPLGIRHPALDQEVATSQDIVEGVQSAVYVVGMDECSPEAR